MVNVILRRLGWTVIVVFGVTLITFLISRVIPGDPALLLAGPRASPELLEQIREQLGLNQALPAQYMAYLANLSSGDFGLSIQTGQPALSEVLRYMPATIELMLLALLISGTVGVFLGVMTAVYKDTLFDNVVRGLASIGISTPSFWLGLILIVVFYSWLNLLPGAGRLDGALAPPPAITHFFTVDALLAKDWLALKSAINHIILPAITLSLISIGAILRLVRSSMIDVLAEDYIRTARAHGIRRHVIIFNHGLRNALIPFVTVLGLELATLLFGSVVVESVFAWPGIGSYVLSAILSLDFPVIMCFTFLTSIVYVLANLLVDLLYMLLNPQIREVG